MRVKQNQLGGFPSGAVVKNPPANAGGTGLIPGPVSKSPHATWCGKKKQP